MRFDLEKSCVDLSIGVSFAGILPLVTRRRQILSEWSTKNMDPLRREKIAVRY